MSGGACFCCGVLCSSRACAVTRSKHVQRRVRSLLANVLSAGPCGRSFAPWAAHSELLLSLHCDSCSWMIGTFLLLFTLPRDVSPCSLTYFCMYSILGHILRVRIQRLRNPQCWFSLPVHFSMACAPSVSCETTAACLISSSTSGCSSSDTLCSVHVRVMFHRCGVDRERQDKCIHASFNVRLNSCCRFFTGCPNCLQAASLFLRLLWRLDDFLTQAYHHDSLLSFLVCFWTENWTCLSSTTLRTTCVDKLLVQLVRLVHRFTCITADLAHTWLTIRLAAVELDPDVRTRLLLDMRTVNLMLLQLLLLRPLLLHEKEMLLRRLSIVAPFAAIILRIVLGETIRHGLTLLTGPPVLSFPLAQGNRCWSFERTCTVTQSETCSCPDRSTCAAKHCSLHRGKVLLSWVSWSKPPPPFDRHALWGSSTESVCVMLTLTGPPDCKVAAGSSSAPTPNFMIAEMHEVNWTCAAQCSCTARRLTIVTILIPSRSVDACKATLELSRNSEYVCLSASTRLWLEHLCWLCQRLQLLKSCFRRREKERNQCWQEGRVDLDVRLCGRRQGVSVFVSTVSPARRAAFTAPALLLQGSSELVWHGFVSEGLVDDLLFKSGNRFEFLSLCSSETCQCAYHCTLDFGDFGVLHGVLQCVLGASRVALQLGCCAAYCLYICSAATMTCVNGSTELNWLAGSGVVVLNSCSATMCELRVLLWFIGLVYYIGHSQPPQLNWARVYCGCQPGPTRVALHPGRVVKEPERQPYVHWTTCYDYRGDVDYRRVFLHPSSTCSCSRSGRSWEYIHIWLLSHFLVDCTVCCVRPAGFLPRCWGCTLHWSSACHLCTPSGTMIHCKQREKEWSSRSLNTPETRWMASRGERTVPACTAHRSFLSRCLCGLLRWRRQCSWIIVMLALAMGLSDQTWSDRLLARALFVKKSNF